MMLYDAGLCPKCKRPARESGVLCRRCVAKMRRRRSRFSGDVLRWVGLYAQGATLRALAQTSGASIDTVRALLRQRGVRLRPRGRRTGGA